MKSWAKTLFFIAIGAYLISLILPCIFYKPNKSVSPIINECYKARTYPNYVCYQNLFGDRGRVKFFCAEPNNNIKAPIVERQKVLQYCVGSDKIETSNQGYFLLLFGWLGMFFAWAANPCFLYAIFAIRSGKYIGGLSASLIAFAIGLNSFRFGWCYLNEAGSQLYVDHLGIGFYAWELSFLLMAASCLMKLLEVKKHE